MFLLTASLVERQSLMIAEPDNALGLPTYSKYGIGMSILAIPFYLIGKILSMVMGIDPAMATQFCVSMINAFLSAGTCLLVYRFARERLWFSPKTALALAVAYGFSTMAWFYSEDFMSEPAATLLILLAVWWIMGASAGSSHGFYWGAGIFLGLAVLCRLNSLIVVPGFVLYCFLIAHNPSIKNFQTWVGDLMRLLVPVALCILLICIYNYARFGDFLETGYESGFGSGFLTGFLGILFSPGKSIFLYNPMIILGLLAIPQFCRKQKPVFVLFAWIVGVHLLLFSFWHSWYGGMGWGPRLMVVTLPFLILPMGFLLELNARKWMKPFIALLVLGLLIQTASVLVNPARYYYDLRQQFGERSETLLIHSPQHSPLVGQWKQVMIVIRQMRDQQRVEAMVSDAKSGRQFIGKGDKEVLENGLAVNVPNFWWYYMKLFGYPWLLYGFPPMLLIATFLFCGFHILKNHSE